MIGQRPVHGLDDVVALAEFLQGRLGPVGDDPLSRLDLGGEAIAFQPPCPVDQQVPVLRGRDSISPSSGRRSTTPWSCCSAISIWSSRVSRSASTSSPSLRPTLELGLVAQFQRDQLARPMADAMGDVVAGDVEDLAVVEHAPDDDMGVGMAGVVVIDRDPVELRAEVGSPSAASDRG